MKLTTPLGQFRRAYASGTAIDTTGEYRDYPFSGPSDIQAYLIDRPDLLAHNLTDRLVTSALRELIHVITTTELMQQP